MRSQLLTLYNADDADGCYKLFYQTAESVLASTRNPLVAEALLEVTNISMEMQQKLWVLRCAFDTMVDELAEKQELLEPAPPQEQGPAEEPPASGSSMYFA